MFQPTSNRWIVALNFSAMVHHGFVLLLVATVVPNIISTFGIGESRAGLLLSLGSLGFTVGPLLAGTIIDRFNVRISLIIGIALQLLVFWLFGSAQVFAAAAAANFVLHLGGAFIETSANVMPTIVRTGRSAHSAMNLVHVGFSVGALAGPFLVGLYIAATGEWRPTLFLVMVPTTLILLWALAVRVPDTASRLPAAINRPKVFAGLLLVLRRPYVLFGALSLFFSVGAEVGLSSWVVYYLQQELQFSTVASASGLSVLWLFMLVGRGLNTVLGNRFRSLTLVSFSGIGVAVGIAAFLFARSIGPAYALLGWVGLCASGIFPNVMAELNNRDPAITGTVTAVIATGAAAGAAVFRWLLGYLAETASLTVALAVPGVLHLLLVGAFAAAVSSAGGPRADN